MTPLRRVADMLPKDLRRRLVRATRRPAVGGVDLGDLRRTTPLSRKWGGDRGTPVDRWYIERFLEANADAVHGTVGEIGEDLYASRIGGDRLTALEILDVDAGNPRATRLIDLGRPESMPESILDTFIGTQVLQLVQDQAVAVQAIHRCLRPGGTALLTVPGISKIYRSRVDGVSDRWRYTAEGARALFATRFEDVAVGASGNVLSATAFLHGLAAEELSVDELTPDDEEFQLVIGIRARRAPA